jgi:hypothetical protein
MVERELEIRSSDDVGDWCIDTLGQPTGVVRFLPVLQTIENQYLISILPIRDFLVSTRTKNSRKQILEIMKKFKLIRI